MHDSLCRWLIALLRPCGAGIALLAVLLLLQVAFGALQPWPLKIVVDYVLQQRPFPEPLDGWVDAVTRGKPFVLLLLVVGAGLGLQVVGQALAAAGTHLQVKLGQRLVDDLRCQVFDHLQALGLRHHLATRTADSVYHIEADTYCIENLVVSGLMPLASSVTMLVVMFAVLVMMDVTVALLSLSVVPVLYVCLRYYMTRLAGRIEHVKELETHFIQRVYETFASIKLVKSFAREPHESKRFRRLSREVIEARVRTTRQEALFSAVVTTTTFVGTAIVLVVGGLRVLQAQMTVGDLLVVIAYLHAVYDPLSAVAHTVGQLPGALAGARRLRSVFARAPEVSDAPHAIDAAGIRGAIGFEHVSFAYPDGTVVLRDINFSVQPGEMVALVGMTGAGKTTLVSLVPRVYDVSAGRVLVDGVDVRHYRLRSLRERVAVVLQEPILFSDTIRENLRYGRLDATDEEIEEAARAALAHEFISRLPRGYDTPIAEAGASLSGGERQRLAIARALLKDAPVLILDEPTSALDALSEEAVFQALRRLRADRTTLVIAHRLSTVRDADRILVLDGGRLVADGRHERLLETCPLYRAMCERLNLARTPSGSGADRLAPIVA